MYISGTLLDYYIWMRCGRFESAEMAKCHKHAIVPYLESPRRKEDISLAWWVLVENATAVYSFGPI